MASCMPTVEHITDGSARRTAGNVNTLSCPCWVDQVNQVPIDAAGAVAAACKDPKMQQLILYDDKAKLAFEAVEKKMELGRCRKRKREIKDFEAYQKGKKSAKQVNLGVKALPSCA